MKITTLLFLLLITYTTNAQIKSGFAIYSVKVTENKESNLEKMMLSMNSNYYSIISEFEFNLQFNKEKSLFQMVDKLYSENDAAKLGGLKIGFLGNCLIKNDSVFKEGKSSSVGEYILKKSLPHNWQLWNETKLIDNYVCYKATTEHLAITKEKTFRHPITAWYCPQIPFSFGPLGYGGLPGLILELQTKDAVFGAKEMKLSIKNRGIDELKKYKIFTEEELNALFQKKNRS